MLFLFIESVIKSTHITINPLLPCTYKSARIIIISKLEGIIKKNSYARRDYESVEKRANLRLCPTYLMLKTAYLKLYPTNLRL